MKVGLMLPLLQVIKAIEGGTSVLQGLNNKLTQDDVTSVMDNLADVRNCFACLFEIMVS